MSDDRLAFCFGIHNHQPVGQFEHVLVEATERGYRPFLERLAARPEVRLTVHWTGSLLEWLREHSPATFDLLGTVLARGQAELLTGGFYEPILAVLPDGDKVGQIERLTQFLKSNFGVRPRGMWLAERVWEPQLPRALREAGVEYVLVDDSHFTLAGLDAETLGGYFLTEEQGAVLGVFPINQRLRYLIPFADVEDSVRYLETRRGQARALTMADDGEKFGVWPGTHSLVYGERWLDRFFDRLLGTPWLDMTTFADVVDRFPASGRVYLPTASYREMGEWALSTGAGEALESAKRELAPLAGAERLTALLRGGFWRGFLMKYPEVADTYWKMLRLSQAIQREQAGRPDDTRLTAARTALWRGQANDAYWHGVFGGCYLPHLRRAVKQALLDAERLLDEATSAPSLTWWRGDGNGDGNEEIFVRTPALSVTVNPAMGGSITELAYRPRGLDLADVLARRPEVYHEQVRRKAVGDAAPVRSIHDVPSSKEAGLEAWLAYDDLRRVSLLDGLFSDTGAIEAVLPWSRARHAFGRALLPSRVSARGGSVTIELGPERRDGLEMDKHVTIRGATVEATYRLRLGDAERAARWGVQWNLALTAGDAPGRYFDLPGRPSLGSAGRQSGISAVGLVDEWIGVEARLHSSRAAEVAWGPVETVSVSEGGFERIYQGTALLFLWSLEDAGDTWEVTVDLTVATR